MAIQAPKTECIHWLYNTNLARHIFALLLLINHSLYELNKIKGHIDSVGNSILNVEIRTVTIPYTTEGWIAFLVLVSSAVGFIQSSEKGFRIVYWAR